MKSILLKLDDELFEETEEIIKHEKTSRTNYIKKAIEHYNKLIERKALEKQLAYESKLVRKESLALNEEISESYSSDFMNDEY